MIDRKLFSDLKRRYNNKKKCKLLCINNNQLREALIQH
ncbi:hypothetical protein LCGC14_1741320 [marine sediment metagenome]|uniref:Uncharacterized protein n=1 Tax=marine sediment metagenome TaxID=412755 RepID=A0A0F9JLS8_9ZZZZ